MQRIEITQDLAVPAERAYAFLAEHENLGPLLGARVTRVRDGDDSRNGVGSVRRLKVGPLPAFEETVVEAVPDELIVYRISGGLTPLRDHRGALAFAPKGAGCTVSWVVELSAVLPLLDRVVALALARSIRAGLARVDARA